MLTVRTIVHPTDFSERSTCALSVACALARDYGARLVVVHVVTLPVAAYGEGLVAPDPGELQANAQRELNEVAIPGADFAIERRVLEGDVATEVLRLADELAADLIVLGTHGRTGLLRLLMGSVAEQVVRGAHCPVLTVKAPFPLKVSAEDALPAVPAVAT